MFLFISFFFFFTILPTHTHTQKPEALFQTTALDNSATLPSPLHSGVRGGSLSVLLTSYKAGGACFPRLIFLSHIFYAAQIDNFTNKKMFDFSKSLLILSK